MSDTKPEYLAFPVHLDQYFVVRDFPQTPDGVSWLVAPPGTIRRMDAAKAEMSAMSVTCATAWR